MKLSLNFEFSFFRCSINGKRWGLWERCCEREHGVQDPLDRAANSDASWEHEWSHSSSVYFWHQGGEEKNIHWVEITTVFVDTRRWKTKHPRKRVQNFRQSCVLSTDRIEIHQSQPASMMYRRSEDHTSGCEWWISIRTVDNTQDWRKFWTRFRGCFVFQSRVSTKTVEKP